jgi:hypothetical protein
MRSQTIGQGLFVALIVISCSAVFAANGYLIPLAGSTSGADAFYRTEMTATNLGSQDAVVTVGNVFPAPGRECRLAPVLAFTIHAGETIPFSPVGCELLGAYKLNSTEPLAFTLDAVAGQSRQPIQVVSDLFAAGSTALIPGIQISLEEPAARANLFIIGPAHLIIGTLRRRQQLTGGWVEMPITFTEVDGGVHVFSLPTIAQQCIPGFECPTEYELEVHSDEPFYAGVSWIRGTNRVWRPGWRRE